MPSVARMLRMTANAAAAPYAPNRSAPRTLAATTTEPSVKMRGSTYAPRRERAFTPTRRTPAAACASSSSETPVTPPLPGLSQPHPPSEPKYARSGAERDRSRTPSPRAPSQGRVASSSPGWSTRQTPPDGAPVELLCRHRTGLAHALRRAWAPPGTCLRGSRSRAEAARPRTSAAAKLLPARPGDPGRSGA